MFDTLVESGSHADDLARKGSFFLGTMVIYAIVLVAVTVVGIYLYNDSIPDPSLELLTLVAPAPMQAQEEAKPKEEAKPAKAEPQTAMVKEMAVIAPVTKTNEVASEKAKVVQTNKSLSVVVGDRDVGDVNAVSTGSVVGVGTGGGGGGGGAPVVVSNEEPPPPPPKPTPEKKTIVSGGVLNGKAISKPQPAYPPIAKAARASGTVTVQVTVDEEGNVISASAVSG